MAHTIHKENIKKIQVLDERFYEVDKEIYVPGATTVLDAYPKGFGFYDWMKKNGADADKIRDEAAKVGSAVHQAIDDYLNDFEIFWAKDDKNEEQHYTLEQWQMICKFMDFFETHKPFKYRSELVLASSKLGYGGTMDMVCQIGNETWLIDHKTSNYIWKTHEIQLASYAKLLEECEGVKVDRMGILHLKASTRGPDKTGKKIQGEGWQLKEITRDRDELIRLFGHTLRLWQEENPNFKPRNLTYPDRFKRKKGK